MSAHKLRNTWNLAKFAYNWGVSRGTVVSNLPVEISIEVTNVCNFKCHFCPQSDPHHFDHLPKTFLDPETARELVRKVREFGYRKSMLHWTLDGEPFVNQRFPEICTVAAEEGFTNQCFPTNGSLLTEERLKRLPPNVRFTFRIDFCADAQYFETYRGTSGSWSRVRDNIARILVDESLSNLRFVVTDISSFTVTARDELTQRMRDLKALFPDSPRIRFHSKTFHNSTGYLDNFGRNGARYNLCPYPWSSMTIASNGDVVACCRDLSHKTVLGNVFETPLEEIWNNARYRELRRNLRDRSPEKSAACKECDLPYDQDRFSVRHIARTVVNRLQAFR